eukprot:jgi/Chlat1/5083/Chrsp33S05004
MPYTMGMECAVCVAGMVAKQSHGIVGLRDGFMRPQTATTAGLHFSTGIVGGICALFALDRGVGMGLSALGFQFPSTVVCLAIIAAVLAPDPKLSDTVYRWFAPAIGFLQRWIQAFYVPTMASIALSPIPAHALSSGAIMVGAGCLYALVTTAGIVLAIQRLFDNMPTKPQRTLDPQKSFTKASEDAARNAGKLGAIALSAAAIALGGRGKVASAAVVAAGSLERMLDKADAAAAAERLHRDKAARMAKVHSALQAGVFAASGASLFAWPQRITTVSAAPAFITMSVMAFLLMSKLPKAIRTWVNPAILSGMLMAAAASVVGAVRLSGWRVGIQCYMQTSGKAIMAFITPAVISLAFKVHTERAVIKKNLKPLLLTCMITVPSCLICSAWLGRLLKAPWPVTAASLSKTSTLGLALAMTMPLRADESLIVAAVTSCGTLGMSISRALLSAIGVTPSNPLARGIAVTSCCHVAGVTVLMEEEPEAAAVASVAFPIIGVLNVLAASVPQVRHFLRALAGC